jgi:hypothetical protein
MPNHDVNLSRIKLLSRINNVLQQVLARKRMQYFGDRRSHARSATRSQDNNLKIFR